MNWIFIAVFSLSVLTTVHCLNEKTIGELKSTLEPLQKRLNLALASYEKQKYVAFQHAVALFETVSELTVNLTDNATLDSDPNLGFAFHRLTFYQSLYPLLSDPIKLSDTLKMHVLDISLKQNPDPFWNGFNDSLTYGEVKNQTKSIIEMENNGHLEVANVYLEKLFQSLLDRRTGFDNTIDVFYLTSGVTKRSLKLLEQYCNNPIGENCSSTRLQMLQDSMINLKHLDELLPFDTPEKVDKMMKIIKENQRINDIVYNLAIEEPFECDSERCKIAKDAELKFKRKADRTIHRTLPELIRVVEHYKPRLDEAISGYKHHQQTVFARTALKFVFSESLKSRIKRLPEHSTIDDSLEAKQTFIELTIYKYLYPILNDPYELSKALIENALLNEIVKNIDPSDGLNKTEETILQIVAELERTNYNLNRTNQILNNLFDHLGVLNPETFVLTVPFISQQIKVTEEFCQSESGLCSEELISNLRNFDLWNNQRLFPPFYFSYLPHILEEFWKFRNLVEGNKKEENINCGVLKCTKKAKQ